MIFVFGAKQVARIDWVAEIESVNGSAAVHANGRKYLLGLEYVMIVSLFNLGKKTKRLEEVATQTAQDELKDMSMVPSQLRLDQLGRRRGGRRVGMGCPVSQHVARAAGRSGVTQPEHGASCV